MTCITRQDASRQARNGKRMATFLRCRDARRNSRRNRRTSGRRTRPAASCPADRNRRLQRWYSRTAAPPPTNASTRNSNPVTSSQSTCSTRLTLRRVTAGLVEGPDPAILRRSCARLLAGKRGLECRDRGMTKVPLVRRKQAVCAEAHSSSRDSGVSVPVGSLQTGKTSCLPAHPN